MLLSSIFQLGGSKLFRDFLPIQILLAVSTIAQVGLIFYVLMAGLEMNLDFVLRAPKKPRIIAICSTLIPMILGIGIYSLVPVLANILVDLKLLYTRLGKLALTVATHNDFYNWIMFALVFPFLVNGYRAIFSMPCVIAFILLSHFVLRPLLEKIVAKKPNKHDWTNYQLSFVIMGLFACTGLTDVLGVNPLVGALIYGLAIPRGSFTEMLMERSDDFGSRYLAPLFFFSGGLRCNVVKILQTVDLDFVVIVILSIFTKMVTTFADCRFGFCCYSDLVYLHKDGYNICSYSLLWYAFQREFGFWVAYEHQRRLVTHSAQHCMG
ncbi:Cation/H(+) antiporter [Arachis hypogaea]|nr:Cation/H(+) antiporter [Arachis hypogaea]